jgi:hypothetical protein
VQKNYHQLLCGVEAYSQEIFCGPHMIGCARATPLNSERSIKMNTAINSPTSIVALIGKSLFQRTSLSLPLFVAPMFHSLFGRSSHSILFLFPLLPYSIPFTSLHFSFSC